MASTRETHGSHILIYLKKKKKIEEIDTSWMTDSLEVVLSFADSFGRRAFLSLKTNSLSFSLFINPFFFFSFFFCIEFLAIISAQNSHTFSGFISISLCLLFVSSYIEKRKKQIRNCEDFHLSNSSLGFIIKICEG